MQEYIADIPAIPAIDKVQLAGLAKQSVFYWIYHSTHNNPFIVLMVYGGNQGNYVSHKKSHHFFSMVIKI